MLTQRPESDPWWARQWHAMGTIISPEDTVLHDDEIDFEDPSFNPLDSYNPIIERLLTTGELDQGGTQIAQGPFLFNARYRKGIRGPESTVMFCAGVEFEDCEPRQGRLYDVASLAATPPEGGLIVGHGFSIRSAAATYNTLTSH